MKHLHNAVFCQNLDVVSQEGEILAQYCVLPKTRCGDSGGWSTCTILCLPKARFGDSGGWNTCTIHYLPKTRYWWFGRVKHLHNTVFCQKLDLVSQEGEALAQYCDLAKS